MKNVSVILPSYNEEKDIANCLRSLDEQSYKNFEVILVDDGSNDNTIKEAKKFKKVRVLQQEHKGPGAARNLGASNAKGKILIFVDVDMTFDKKYIENLIKPILKDKNILGTTHDFEVVENQSNIWSRCWGRVRVSKEEAHKVKIFRAIRRDKFLELEGFDSKYGYADDQTFWFKYKIKPVVAENTKCYHKNPESLKSVFSQSRWIGASIDNKLLNLKVVKYFLPLLLILISPVAILFYSCKKAFNNKDLRILFPWMFVFMTYRYFGTVAGIMRKLYLDMNAR